MEGIKNEELEKKILHDKLRSLVDYYEEMTKRMRGSSSIEQLLITCTDLPYSEEVTVVPLPFKFKVPQID